MDSKSNMRINEDKPITTVEDYIKTMSGNGEEESKAKEADPSKPKTMFPKRGELFKIESRGKNKPSENQTHEESKSGNQHLVNIKIRNKEGFKP